MGAIGNDIVDLKTAAGHHPRFPVRALGPEGHAEWLAAGADPLWLWQAWTAKEAVLKLVRQRRAAKVSFHPGAMRWHHAARELTWSGEVFRPFHAVTAGYVHAWCAEGTGRLVTAVATVESSNDPGQEGRAVRSLALDLLTSNLGAAIMAGASLGQDPVSGRPVLTLAGRESEVALSFSHDGGHVAVALLIPGNPLVPG